MQVLTEFNQALDQWARETFSWVPDKPNLGSSLTPSWFIPPTVQFWETLLLNIALVVLIKKFSGTKPKISLARKLGKGVACIDWFLFSIMLTSFVTIMFDKYRCGTLAYILQPCHIFTIMIITTQFLPQTSTLALHLFNCVLCCNTWGTLLAIVFADLRDYKENWAIAAFWTQHAALLILPLWWVAIRKYPIMEPTVAWCMVYWGLKSMYHWNILLPASLLFGENFNYMLTPPPGPLGIVGIYYRVPQGLFCLVLTFAARFLMVGLVCWIVGIRWEGREKKGQ